MKQEFDRVRDEGWDLAPPSIRQPVHPEVVGDRVVLVTQTALSAVSQAAQPAGRRREPGAWTKRQRKTTGSSLQY